MVLDYRMRFDLSVTHLQVIPNFCDPVEFWDGAIRNTVYHHVELGIEMTHHLYKCGDKYHIHRLQGPAAECE